MLDSSFLKLLLNKALILNVPFYLLLCQLHLLHASILSSQQKFFVKAQLYLFNLLFFRFRQRGQKILCDICLFLLQLLLFLKDSIRYFDRFPILELIVLRLLRSFTRHFERYFFDDFFLFWFWLSVFWLLTRLLFSHVCFIRAVEWTRYSGGF